MKAPDRPLPVQNPLQYSAPKPVWWLVCMVGENDQIYHSRWANNKYSTPVEAYHNAYGRGSEPSGNVLFFNLTSRLEMARRINRAVSFYANTYTRSWKEETE